MLLHTRDAQFVNLNFAAACKPSSDRFSFRSLLLRVAGLSCCVLACDDLLVTCSVTFFAGVIDACYMESVVSCEVIAANVDSTYRVSAAKA